MTKHTNYYFLIFIMIFCIKTNAQSIDLLDFISYNKKNIKKINIYKHRVGPINDSVIYNEDSILDSFTNNSKTNIKEIVDLYGFINFDSLGRVTSYNYSCGFFYSIFMCEKDILFNYPDEKSVCYTEHNQQFYTVPTDINSAIHSDSIIYHYYENEDKYKMIDAHFQGNVILKRITIKFIYRTIKNCTLIVVTYQNDKIKDFNFYEFIYNDKKN